MFFIPLKKNCTSESKNRKFKLLKLIFKHERPSKLLMQHSVFMKTNILGKSSVINKLTKIEWKYLGSVMILELWLVIKA